MTEQPAAPVTPVVKHGFYVPRRTLDESETEILNKMGFINVETLKALNDVTGHKHDYDIALAKKREYNASPKVKERRKEYFSRPDVKERRRQYSKSPQVKERKKAISKKKAALVKTLREKHPELYVQLTAQ